MNKPDDGETGLGEFEAYTEVAPEVLAGVDRSTLVALVEQFDAYVIAKARKPGETDEQVLARVDAEIKAELRKALLEPGK